MLRGKNTIPQALEQTAEYMDKSDATEGHLIVFDPDKTKTWDEKIYHSQQKFEGKKIDVWGM